ncbi:MAG: hypothetical protein LBB45_01805 [Methanobrevibacter sp.]|jgi:hypothetical protein|nr:hypothetical protein [Candidatus Methanovirga basalitermitum]
MDKKSIRLTSSQVLFLIGDTGTVGIVKVAKEKFLFIGTPDKEEIVIFLEEDDIIAISAFGKGEKYEKAIKSMAYLIREMNSPIVVLEKDHPSSKRLDMVLSAGNSVLLSCNIVPGTHPEQDILCSCDSLSGLVINKTIDGVEIEKDFDNYKIEEI